MLILLVWALEFSLTIPRPASVEASENIIRVPSDFPTIQAAINVAKNGSTILVNSGIYYETFVINKSLNLIGADEKDTIIDGLRDRFVIAVWADNVRINGFTVRNSSLVTPTIALDQVSGCSIDGNIVTLNGGAGILLHDSHLNIIHNNIVSFTEGYSEMTFGAGIELLSSANNTISDNIITDSILTGISLDSSHNNSVHGNVIQNSRSVGISTDSSGNNTFVLNSFIDDTEPETLDSPSNNNSWSANAEGNYWDDYLGLDDGSNGRVAGDGVGDTDIPHHGVDNYPLVQPVEPIRMLWENEAYILTLRCNSTVSALRFEQADKKVTFSVGGPSNTTGYFNVTVPKALLSGNPWKIALNGADVTSQTIIGTNQTHTSIYLGYAHSSHDVQLIGTSVVPEYPTPSIIALMMLLTLLSIINYRTKKRRNCP